MDEFNGKVSEWKSFIANFDRMIHNNMQIDDEMKIEYLKMSIKGDAAMLLSTTSTQIQKTIKRSEILNNLIASLIKLTYLWNITIYH